MLWSQECVQHETPYMPGSRWGRRSEAVTFLKQHHEAGYGNIGEEYASFSFLVTASESVWHPMGSRCNIPLCALENFCTLAAYTRGTTLRQGLYSRPPFKQVVKRRGRRGSSESNYEGGIGQEHMRHGGRITRRITFGAAGRCK